MFIYLAEEGILFDRNLLACAQRLTPGQGEQFSAATRVELTTGTYFNIQAEIDEFALTVRRTFGTEEGL